jgi:hypothetical protein
MIRGSSGEAGDAFGGRNRRPPRRLSYRDFREAIIQEAILAHWQDRMVDRPEDDEAAYVAGWTISGLAVLGAIMTVWVFGI